MLYMMRVVDTMTQTIDFCFICSLRTTTHCFGVPYVTPDFSQIMLWSVNEFFGLAHPEFCTGSTNNVPKRAYVRPHEDRCRGWGFHSRTFVFTIITRCRRCRRRNSTRTHTRDMDNRSRNGCPTQIPFRGITQQCYRTAPVRVPIGVAVAVLGRASRNPHFSPHKLHTHQHRAPH